MKTYLSYKINQLDASKSELLNAQLMEMGSMGSEETEEGLLVYFDAHADKEKIAECIQNYTSDFELGEIPEQNWNAEWESNFQPVAVDNFCYIKAYFHPEQTGFDYTIHITPKMSFGTGHHATTYQVIQMMKLLDWQGKTVLDFGTGTGILAILAEKLGAQHIDAIDHDSWSVENALENVQINHCQHIDVSNKTIQQLDTKAFDLILANINRHVLIENMGLLSQVLKPGAQLIMSGILIEDEAIIIQEAGRYELTLKAKSEKNNWLCLFFENKV